MLDVKISPEEDTVYLSQNQIALLFETSQQNISNHITNIVEEEELSYEATHKDFLLVQLEGDREVKRSVAFYNLDMILSIGYRVKSKTAIAFRKWATNILKQYLFKGYVLDNNRIVVSKDNFVQLENDVASLKEEVADIKERVFVEPIKQKIFFDGTYFDAYEFIVSLVNKAKSKITIIDPYFDTKGLNILKVTSKEIIRVVCLSSKARLSDYDVEQFKKQYGDIQIIYCDTFHDRFLIIDDNECYVLGTSLNYMGNKTFGVNKVEDQMVIKGILKRIED